jgi:hypothetical protein
MKSVKSSGGCANFALKDVNNMGFRFHILKIWRFDELPSFHAIGLLEDGTIVPPAKAQVVELDGQVVEIESIALGGGRPVTGQENELTLVIRNSVIEPRLLEGTHLVPPPVTAATSAR